MLAIAELAVGEALSPNGTVFAISDTAALTARHCVYDGETLLTPLVAILPGGIQLRASLLDEDERADVALLLLKDPLPEKWEPVALLDASECRPQTPFVVSGYPAQRPFKDADTMDGHIVSVSATAFDGVPVITLFSSQVAASVPRDPHGFSGAPVLVTLGPDGTKLAVGLIRWSEIDPITGLVRAGSVLAAPLEPLSRRWPQLARAVVTVPSTLLLEPKVIARTKSSRSFSGSRP